MRYLIVCHGWHLGRIDVSDAGEVIWGSGPGLRVLHEHKTVAEQHLREWGAKLVGIADADTWPDSGEARGLAQNCVLWSLERLGMRESKSVWKSSPEIREWFAPCVRRDTGKPLGLVAGNWCAAFACAAAQACRSPEEQFPHGYRASGLELQLDALEGHCWVPGDDIRLGRRRPRPGDVCIWDRSLPPEQDPTRRTSWWRHVNRVVRCDEKTLVTVGGNEHGGMVAVSEHFALHPKLLGLIAYPPAAEERPRGDSVLDEDEKRRVMGLVALTLRDLGDKIVDSW